MKASYSSYGHYSSSCENSTYRIEFETDDKELFELVMEGCRVAVNVAKRKNKEKENETDKD